MKLISSPTLLGLLFVSIFLPACTAPRPAGSVGHYVGETLVCVDSEPARLAHDPLPNFPVTVRSTYLLQTNTVTYVSGKDYVVDYKVGAIRRTPESRIPNFRTNLLFGLDGFDHSKFPYFGNAGFFIYVDYSFAPSNAWPQQPDQSQFLKATQAKLAAGESVRVIAFGDSITAGADARNGDLIFWQRWLAALRQKYPRSSIEGINGATGGDSTVQGLERLRAKVLERKPDLVLIGFGMNDNNLNGVPVPQFKSNLVAMIHQIRAETGAEIILYSTFPPNPKWKFGSPHMAEYAAATQQAATENQCAYADIYDNWQTLAVRKKPEDLRANDINHPTEFGHWIYFEVFQSLGL